MAEYIDKETLLQKVWDADTRIGYIQVVDVRDILDMPVADVAPVVHGRWEWFDEDTGTPLTGYEREWGWRCTRCKHELPDNYDDPDYRPMLAYCPDCGAKMDKGE